MRSRGADFCSRQPPRDRVRIVTGMTLGTTQTTRVSYYLGPDAQHYSRADRIANEKHIKCQQFS